MSKLLLALALAGCSSQTLPAKAEPLELTKNNQPNATIVLQANAPAPMQEAAADLQKYIQKISGVELPLKTDGKDVSGITLNIGKTATTQAGDMPDAKLNPETYAITQRGDDVYFEGNYPSPTAFAVYSFLQDQLGVRWFAPGDDWEYVPQNANKSTFMVDVKNVVSVPGTSPRVWAGHHWNDDWKAWKLRNKARQSEKVPRRKFQNNMYRIFPQSKYGKTHPEYYPLVNGKRYIPASDDEQLWWPALGDPNVQRITAEYIHQWFLDHPDQDSFSLGMDDIKYMSDDPLTNAMDSSPNDYKNRNFSSRYYKFVNIVAKQVEKTDPGKYIGVLIYSIVVDPPVDVPKMEDNVFGYIANGSVAQWYQEGFKEKWMANTLEWAKRVKHLSRYDYFGLGTYVPRVFPHNMAEMMNLDHSLGFEGNFTEMFTFLPQTAPMIWAFAQKQWNPNLKIDDLLNEFYTKMYGPAAPNMKKYFDLMETSWNTPRPGRIGWVHRNLILQANSISPEAVHQGTDILNKAYNEAKTPVEKRRVDVMRGGLKYASYAVLEYAAAQELSTMSVTNATQAKAGLAKAKEFASLMENRKIDWPTAEKRQDLLGANIRGLMSIKALLQNDFDTMESPVASGILRMLDWYRDNQPAEATKITDQLVHSLPTGFLGDGLMASPFLSKVEQNGAKSLLTNGDFEDNSKNKANAEHDWKTKGAPVGWSTWSYRSTGQFVRSEGRSTQSHGMHLDAPHDGEISILVQIVPAKAGERYVSTVWVKLDDTEHAPQVLLSFRFRDAKGYLKGKGATQRAAGAATHGWQKVILAGTAPKDATNVAVMLGVSNTSASFDDVVLYHMP